MKRFVIGLIAATLLALVTVAGGVTWLLYSTGGARWLLGQAQDRVSGELRVARVTGRLAAGLRLEGLRFADEAMQLDVESLRVTMRAGFSPLTLRIRDLQADGVRYRIAADGERSEPADPDASLALPLPVEVDRLMLRRLRVEDATGAPVFEGDFDARFSAFERLDIDRARLDGDLGSLDVGGRVVLAPPWRMQLSLAGDLRPPLAVDGAPARVRFEGRVEGPLDAYRFDATGTLVGGPIGEAHRFELESAGSSQRISIEALAVDGPLLRLDTGALLDWTAQRLELSALSVLVPDSEFTADADLEVDLAAGRVAGTVRWQRFTWPLRNEPARLSSPEGRATLAGSPDDWTVEGRADLGAEGVPEVALQFRAAGDRHGFEAEIPDGAVLGGTFGGRLAWRWAGAQAISAALRFENLETAPLAPDWPGRLDGEVSVEGEIEPLALTADVARLEGEVRGTRVSGAGRVQYAEQRLRFDGFALRAGGSRVTLQGDPYGSDGLAFDLEVADPGALLPGAAGQATGQGVVSLAGAAPRVTVDLTGSGLAWGDYRLDRLSLRNLPHAGAEARSRLELQGAGLAWNGQQLDTVRLAMNWSADEQRLELAAAQGSYEVTARAAGQPENPGAPLAEWRWSGALSALTLVEDGAIRFELAAPAPLLVSAHASRIDGACLESPAPARVCVDADWTPAAGASGTVSLDHFPLDLAARRLAAGIEATQVLSGTLGFSAPPEAGFSADAELNLSPGALRYIEDPDVALETAAGRIDFSMADGRISTGRLEVPMPGQGGVELEFNVDQLAAGASAPVSGELRVELADLDVLTLVIPAVDHMAGRLQAEFELTGTLGDPGLDGHVALQDGALSNLASGFQVSDLQLSGAVDADRQTRLVGEFRAVDGVGRLAADLDLTSLYDPRVTLEIDGEDLVLFDTATLKLTATPDLRLAWRAGAVEIGGVLAIPRGLVAPNVIPVKPVGESEDVTIVAGKLPDRRTPQKSTPIDLRGSVEVTLGPDVRLKLPVAEAMVTGTTRFSWNGAAIPIGNGAFEMSGEILVLGQLLEITEGTVSFPDVRADIPHLNIHAERDIYGNSEIRRAGVLVTGTLRRPVIEPYTEPMTNRERARTLLVTGSDFNMERGVGTVDVGTYIAPKIFISYGIGVFGQENVFSVRYDLGRSWGVKATSGESQTGLDISYTIEN
ncbi:MAG: translocation/assembly module TamB domain-containing protein [Xanthomonadales bacterium]